MKVSTGQPKSRQKYQNSFAFAPSKHNPKALKIASLPVQGLCQKCYNVIQWKKRMVKYKPLSQPKTCTVCSKRTVKDAYHVICQSCAAQKKCCAKCCQSNEIVVPDTLDQDDKNAEFLDKERLDVMNERQRRSYIRKVERGDIQGANVIYESAKSKSNDFEFSDDFSDESDDDSNDDQQQEQDK